MNSNKKKDKKTRNPLEDKAVRRGVQVALLTDNLLWGAIAMKNDPDYDLKKGRLK